MVFQAIPRSVTECHRLSGVTIKYVKECGLGKQLESICVPIKNDEVYNNNEINHMNGEGGIKFYHSILTDGIELVRATTIWTPNST